MPPLIRQQELNCIRFKHTNILLNLSIGRLTSNVRRFALMEIVKDFFSSLADVSLAEVRPDVLVFCVSVVPGGSGPRCVFRPCPNKALCDAGSVI
ncbi:hypothetical protein AVEN_175331-1 [Araneus ventricosus]|uniref:Uncharacterized protein n=1 Tax=Araneus ventricosus TaxID=182803 RepID=A0A4Y2GXG9_ARAVE|nr:hypothetical protein AVEN_175331-1 [Araneus ventricosus]